MNNKQLVKVIKTLVEAEVAKQHHKFLTEQFPAILNEAVKNKTKTYKKPTVKKVVSEEVDPFSIAEEVLNNERNVVSKKVFTKNSILNEVLNNTKPFSKAQRSGGQVGSGGASVLDSLPQQQLHENTHIPSYASAEPDIEQTINIDSSLGAGGTDAIKSQMAQKMGYGDIGGSNPKLGGLGVQTGLPGLDRILNRDNSALVKKFKK